MIGFAGRRVERKIQRAETDKSRAGKSEEEQKGRKVRKKGVKRKKNVGSRDEKNTEKNKKQRDFCRGGKSKSKIREEGKKDRIKRKNRSHTEEEENNSEPLLCCPCSAQNPTTECFPTRQGFKANHFQESKNP